MRKGRAHTRADVFNKFGGKCAYCGKVMNRQFHIDHFIPRAYFVDNVKNKSDIPSHLTHLSETDLHHFDNLMPMCSTCNMIKGSSSIEGFILRVQNLFEDLCKRRVFGAAIQFGVIQKVDKNITFYFETFIKTKATK